MSLTSIPPGAVSLATWDERTMTASGVTEKVLRDAAKQVQVKMDLSPLNQKGTRWQVKLYPLVPSDAYTPRGQRRYGDRGNAPWQMLREGQYGQRRRVNAVCWHGFRAFFRAVYERTPDARFRTARAVYNGWDHFEEVHPETGDQNIGSAFSPLAHRDACACENPEPVRVAHRKLVLENHTHYQDRYLRALAQRVLRECPRWRKRQLAGMTYVFHYPGIIPNLDPDTALSVCVVQNPIEGGMSRDMIADYIAPSGSRERIAPLLRDLPLRLKEVQDNGQAA